MLVTRSRSYKEFSRVNFSTLVTYLFDDSLLTSKPFPITKFKVAFKVRLLPSLSQFLFDDFLTFLLLNSVGGSFQWPPQREEEEQGATAVPMYINPNVGGSASPAHHFDDRPQSTGQGSGFHQPQHEYEQQQRQFMEYQQQHKQQQQQYQQQQQVQQQQVQQQQQFQQQQFQQQQFQHHQQQQQQVQSKSILKQTAPPPAPIPEPEPAPVVGPGQNVVAPRRGMGVLKQQQPGMRVPVCGACDSQIRFEPC